MHFDYSPEITKHFSEKFGGKEFVNLESSSGECPLVFALQKYPDWARSLFLLEGVNLKVRDKSGNNILHLLLSQPSLTDVAERVVKEGSVELYAMNEKLETPFMIGTRNNSITKEMWKHFLL